MICTKLFDIVERDMYMPIFDGAVQLRSLINWNSVLVSSTYTVTSYWARCLDCLLNRLFRHRSKKTSKLSVTGPCEGNRLVTGGFSSQRVSNAVTFDDIIMHKAWNDKMDKWWVANNHIWNNLQNSYLAHRGFVQVRKVLLYVSIFKIWNMFLPCVYRCQWCKYYSRTPHRFTQVVR